MPHDIKRSVIAVVVVICAAVFWVVARQWMYAPGHFENWPGMLISGVLLTVTGAVIALGFLLFSGTPWRWGIIGGVLATFLAVNGVTILYLAGAVAVTLVWWRASNTIGRELTDRRTIRLRSVLSHGMPLIFLGLYLLLSFAFYLTPAAQDITQKEATQAFQGQLDATSDIVLDSELSKLPPSQREEVKRQISNQAVKTFIGVLKFRFCISLDTCSPSVLELLPPLYAFLFFITIWGFGFIFRECAVMVGSGVFYFLHRLQVVNIVEVDTKAQVLKL